LEALNIKAEKGVERYGICVEQFGNCVIEKFLDHWVCTRDVRSELDPVVGSARVAWAERIVSRKLRR